MVTSMQHQLKRGVYFDLNTWADNGWANQSYYIEKQKNYKISYSFNL